MFTSGEPWKIIWDFALTGNTNGSTSGHQCLLTKLNKLIITENNRVNLQNQVIFVKQNSPTSNIFRSNNLNIHL